MANILISSRYARKKNRKRYEIEYDYKKANGSRWCATVRLLLFEQCLEKFVDIYKREFDIVSFAIFAHFL